MTSSSINVAVIPGDGIGPEVITEAVKVLRAATAAADAELTLTDYKLGAEHWLTTGETLSEEVLDRLRSHDAILFGAVGAAPGDTRIPSGLITNFHQPQSTLLLLISAFIGPSWRKVYDHALENDYRFLSYGDSSLLWREGETESEREEKI